MTKDQTRKQLSSVSKQIEQAFKLSTEDLRKEAQKGFGSLTITDSTRDELLTVVIKGYVFDSFDPDVKRRL